MENLRTAYELLQDLIERTKGLGGKGTPVAHITVRDGSCTFISPAEDVEFYARIEGLMTRDAEEIIDEANAATIRINGKITEYLEGESERKRRRIEALKAELAKLEERA